MATMKAVQVLGDKYSPRVVVSTLARPTPIDSQILVCVHAAGITADELTWPELYATPSRIPGHDISGVVHSFGPSYSGPLQVGQEVFAMISAERGEGQAELCICLENEVAPKPTSISHPEAAVLPIPVITAWEALVNHLHIKKGIRVLVTGASGAVGRVSVQIAASGHIIDGEADVVALASEKNFAILKSLGAQKVVDYKDVDWAKTVDQVDAVFDTVGGDVLSQCWGLVKEDGIIVTVADPPPSWAFGRGTAPEAVHYPGVRYLHFIVGPERERLVKAGQMIDQGHLAPLPVKTFSINQAAEAWLDAKGRGKGYKVALKFAADSRGAS